VFCGKQRRPRRTMPVVSQSIDNGNHVVVKMFYRCVRSLIDTGTASTIMSERLARDLRLPVSSTHRGDYKRLFYSKRLTVT